MARAIVMPSMGMYTEEGVLTLWLRQPGMHVNAGDPVAEITTEKATFEIPAPEAGILHAVAQIGTTLKVEAVMGYILQDGEAAPTTGSILAGAKPAPVTAATGASVSTQHASPEGPLRASPVAKRMAAQHGIDLKQVKGTGPGGRIVEVDIQALIEKSTSPTPAVTQPALERVPMAGLRRSLAQRLHKTLTTAASTTLTREADADVLVAARKSLTQKLGQAPSFDALFIKLFAAALRERPELNAVLESDTIVRLSEINIGFAVAVPNGLIVPVVRHADSAPLASIATQVKELTDRVLIGRLHLEDVEGGTATISNLGFRGIDAFTPILNASQSVILGIGRIAERPVVRNSTVAVGHTCVLSLTFDHRVTDGAPAALLLDAVVRRMNDEKFLAMLGEK